MSDKPTSGDLFGFEDNSPSQIPLPINQPLAERMRPKSLDDFVGQEDIVGENGALRPLLEKGHLHSMIFWGDPGVGKTTLARILADHMQADFLQLSAVTSGVKDVRAVIDRAKKALQINRRTVLFIDEIHRFNKAQQDALLHAVEDGTVILIGATTENPSFEVISPLLSRCRVYRFKQLTNAHLEKLIDRAYEVDPVIQNAGLVLNVDARKALIGLAAGDGRETLNLLERAVEFAAHEKETKINLRLMEKVADQALNRYDKSGERHYDTISAFIKCVRNSDPDAAVYYLARMLVGGEEPLFIARRLIILASEDIGNANPNALLLASAAFDAVHKIGMPEGRIILSQVTTYLATSPKSNASYLAINEAMDEVKSNAHPPIPMHLRNAPTKLMKAQGYSDGYIYAHDQEHAIADMPGLPPELEGHKFYRPKRIGSETAICDRLVEWERNKQELRKNKDESQQTSEAHPETEL